MSCLSVSLHLRMLYAFFRNFKNTFNFHKGKRRVQDFKILDCVCHKRASIKIIIQSNKL